MSARRVGKGTRLFTALQVGAAMVLALGAAWLAIELAEGTYVRVDLSENRRNTLQPEVEDILLRMPEPVRVDVFFRALSPPYDAVGFEAQGRMRELLFTAANAHRRELEVVEYGDRDLERTRARQAELGVEGTNQIVVRCGERSTSVPLFGAVASVDWGNPTPNGLRYLAEQGITGIVDPHAWDPRAFAPARLTGFRGQEALAEALLKVAAAERPRVLFSKGHGEPDLYGSLSTDIGRLGRALERDGFELDEWDGARGAAIPPETELLCVLGAKQPFAEDELAAIRGFVEAGGRVIAAPSYEELEQGTGGGTTALLFGYGMVPQPGVVCEPVIDAMGRSVEGLPECARLVFSGSDLSPSHPLTAALRRRGLRLEFVLSHSFRRGGVGAGGLLLDLVHSSSDSWLDLAGADGTRDFRLHASAGEERGRRRLIMLAERTGALTPEGGQMPTGRVLGVASASFFADGSFDTNRDFLLSAFNWMAEREELVRVLPSSASGSRLDLRKGNTKPILSAVVVAGLPALLALVGACLAWRRRR